MADKSAAGGRAERAGALKIEMVCWGRRRIGGRIRVEMGIGMGIGMKVWLCA